MRSPATTSNPSRILPSLRFSPLPPSLHPEPLLFAPRADVRSRRPRPSLSSPRPSYLIPGLAVVLVGDRKDSETYVRSKKKACAEAGIESFGTDLPGTPPRRRCSRWSPPTTRTQRPRILVQLPMPDHINEERVLGAIDYEKDVDGFHPLNIGRLSQRGREPLRPVPRWHSPAPRAPASRLAGKEAVAVGRSNVVGTPAALLLQRRDATVTIVHSRTPNSEVVKRADIVIVAAVAWRWSRDPDRQRAVRAPPTLLVAIPRVSRTPSPTNRSIDRTEPTRIELTVEPSPHRRAVIDVGINAKMTRARSAGTAWWATLIRGVLRCGHITPVPGGVGPMTIAILLQNTLEGAMRAYGLK